MNTLPELLKERDTKEKQYTPNTDSRVAFLNSQYAASFRSMIDKSEDIQTQKQRDWGSAYNAYKYLSDNVNEIYRGVEDPREALSNEVVGNVLHSVFPNISEDMAVRNAPELIRGLTGDDMKASNVIELAFEKVKQGMAGLGAGFQNLKYLFKYVPYEGQDEEIDRQLQKEQKAMIDAKIGNLKRTDYYNKDFDSFIDKMILAAADFFPSEVASLVPTAVGGALSLVFANPLFFTLGSAAGGVLAGVLEGGSASIELAQAGAPLGTQFGFSWVVGLANGGLEYLGNVAERGTVSSIFNLDKLYKAVGDDQIAKMTARQFGKHLLTEYAVNLVTEPGTEGLQDLTQMFVMNLASEWQKKNTGKSFTDEFVYTPQEMAKNVWNTIDQTFKGQMLMGLGGGIADTLSNLSPHLNTEGGLPNLKNWRWEAGQLKQALEVSKYSKSTKNSIFVDKKNVFISDDAKPYQPYMTKDRKGNDKAEPISPVIMVRKNGKLVPVNSEEMSKAKYMSDNTEYGMYVEIMESEASEGQSITTEEAQKIISDLPDENDKHKVDYSFTEDGKIVVGNTKDLDDVVDSFISTHNYTNINVGDNEITVTSDGKNIVFTSKELEARAFSQKQYLDMVKNVADRIKSEGETDEEALGRARGLVDRAREIQRQDNKAKGTAFRREIRKIVKNTISDPNLRNEEIKKINEIVDNIAAEATKAYKSADLTQSSVIADMYKGRKMEDVSKSFARGTVMAIAKLAESMGISTSDFMSKVNFKFSENPMVDGKNRAGWTTVNADGTYDVYVTSFLDQTTGIHEMSHVYLNMIGDNYKNIEGFLDNFADELKQDGGKVGRNTQEAFARALESYVNNGLAKSEGLKKVFDLVLDALRNFISAVRDLISPEKVAMFDNLFDKGIQNYTEQTDRQLDELTFFAKDAEITENENFMKWFGDSKVVDSEGKPLVAYHGTRNMDFDTFDKSRIGSTGRYAGSGFNFAISEGAANMYKGRDGRIMPVYLRAESPISDTELTLTRKQIADALRKIDDGIDNNDSTAASLYYGKTYEDSLRGAVDFLMGLSNDADVYSSISMNGNDEAVISAFEDLGYDSVIWHEENDGVKTDNMQYVVVFEPNQIKSINNNGQFSRTNDNIYFKTAEELDELYKGWNDNHTDDTGKDKTQIATTRKTYQKLGDFLKTVGDWKNLTILDASSGLGYGTQDLRDMGFNVDDVEPYPSDSRMNNEDGMVAPTYLNYSDINKKYDVVISNAVLNVIPDDWRDDLLYNMGKLVKDGGRLFINVRSASEIENQSKKGEGKTAITLDSPNEILVTDFKDGKQIYRSYQRGFTKDELRDYVQSILGNDFVVEKATKNNVGAVGGTTVVATKLTQYGLGDSDRTLFKDAEVDTIHPLVNTPGLGSSDDEINEYLRELMSSVLSADEVRNIDFNPNRGKILYELPDDFRISTKVPAAWVTEDDNGNPVVMPSVTAHSLNSVIFAPFKPKRKALPFIDKAVNNLLQDKGDGSEPGFWLKKRDGESNASYLIRVQNQLVENLKTLYKNLENSRYGKRVIRQMEMWYDTAHAIGKNLYNNHKDVVFNGHKLTENKVDAILAGYSPSRDWNLNVADAVITMDIVHYLQNSKPTKEMVEYAKNAPDSIRMSDADIESYQNRTFKEMDISQQASFVAGVMEKYVAKHYREIVPAEGVGGIVKTKSGSDMVYKIAGRGEIMRVLYILGNEESEDLYNTLSQQQKVRNFYNNIAYPNSLRMELTADSHAVQAATMRAIGSTAWIAQGGTFGQNSDVGTSFLGGLIADAYRRFAFEIGTLPQRAQAIVWGPAAELLDSAKKKLTKAIYDIEKKYASSDDKNGDLIRSEIVSMLDFDAIKPLESTEESRVSSVYDKVLGEGSIWDGVQFDEETAKLKDVMRFAEESTANTDETIRQFYAGELSVEPYVTADNGEGGYKLFKDADIDLMDEDVSRILTEGGFVSNATLDLYPDNPNVKIERLAQNIVATKPEWFKLFKRSVDNYLVDTGKSFEDLKDKDFAKIAESWNQRLKGASMYMDIPKSDNLNLLIKRLQAYSLMESPEKADTAFMDKLRHTRLGHENIRDLALQMDKLGMFNDTLQGYDISTKYPALSLIAKKVKDSNKRGTRPRIDTEVYNDALDEAFRNRQEIRSRLSDENTVAYESNAREMDDNTNYMESEDIQNILNDKDILPEVKNIVRTGMWDGTVVRDLLRDATNRVNELGASKTTIDKLERELAINRERAKLYQEQIDQLEKGLSDKAEEKIAEYKKKIRVLNMQRGNLQKTNSALKTANALLTLENARLKTVSQIQSMIKSKSGMADMNTTIKDSVSKVIRYNDEFIKNHPKVVLNIDIELMQDHNETIDGKSVPVTGRAKSTADFLIKNGFVDKETGNIIKSFDKMDEKQLTAFRIAVKNDKKASTDRKKSSSADFNANILGLASKFISSMRPQDIMKNLTNEDMASVRNYVEEKSKGKYLTDSEKAQLEREAIGKVVAEKIQNVADQAVYGIESHTEHVNRKFNVLDDFTTLSRLLGYISPELRKYVMDGLNKATDGKYKMVDSRMKAFFDKVKELYKIDNDKKLQKFLNSTMTERIPIGKVKWDEVPDSLRYTMDENGNMVTNEYFKKLWDADDEEGGRNGKTQKFKFSIQNMMAIYELSLEEDGWRHLNSGCDVAMNEIAWVRREFESGSLKEWKPLADTIRGVYGERFENIHDTVLRVENRDMVEVSSYSPMFGVGLTKDLMMRFSDVYASDDRAMQANWFTKDRQYGTNPISLQYFSMMQRVVEMQEAYINGAEFYKELDALFSKDGGNLRNIINEVYDAKTMKRIDTILDLTKSDAVRHIMTEADNMASMVRNHYVLARLAYNMSSVVQQIGAWFIGLQRMGLGRLWRASLEFMSHPITMSNRVYELSPQMKHAVNPVLRMSYEAGQKNPTTALGKVDKFVTSIAEKGLTLMEKQDHLIRNILWWGAYQQEIDTMMKNKSAEMKKEGRKELTAEELDECQRTATQWVLDTQSSSQVKDNSLLYAGGNLFWKNVLMFTNQLNKEWNMLYVDGIKEGLFKKQYGQFFANFAALGLSTMWVVAITGKIKNDEDDDETWAEDLMKDWGIEFASRVPVVGNLAKNVWEGFAYTQNDDIVTRLTQAIAALSNEQKTSSQKLTSVRNLGWSALDLSGGPTTALKRVYNAFGDGEIFDAKSISTLIGGEWNKYFED